MNKTKCFKFAVALMLHAMIVITLLAPVQTWALDVQQLPNDTKAASGFTHGARVTWDDLNASDNASTERTLMTLPTNCYIDRVAWYIEENFANSTASATNLLLTIGVTGSTNAFFTTNQIDGSTTMIAAGKTLYCLSTNMLVPYKSTTAAINLLVTFSAGASVVDTYTSGKIRILWRVVEPAKYRF